MNLEHCRKDAKALLRGVAAQDADALARAHAVLGERVRARFLLSDAQHVVAVERGYRSWRELRAAAPRSERVVESELMYRPGDRVLVYVARRAHRITASDRGAAYERAAVSVPWRGAAERLERELNVNVSGMGAVWLPVVAAGPGERAIVARIARASLTFYEDLLELE
jgi:hypothetical protein